jgi:hypothetical protein
MLLVLIAGRLDVNDEHAVGFVDADDLQFHAPVVSCDPYPLVAVLLSGGTNTGLALLIAASACARPIRCLRADRVNLTGFTLSLCRTQK